MSSWKPLLRVVPGSQGQLWYLIQYLGLGAELDAVYRVFRKHTLLRMNREGVRFDGKKSNQRVFSSAASFRPYYGWTKGNYLCSVEQHGWFMMDEDQHQIIVNFLIDEGYGYARQGFWNEAGSYRRPVWYRQFNAGGPDFISNNPQH